MSLAAHNAWAKVIADRRYELMRAAKTIACPKCRSPQIQLLDPVPIPAPWRCRLCGHRFVCEPAKERA